MNRYTFPHSTHRYCSSAAACFLLNRTYVAGLGSWSCALGLPGHLRRLCCSTFSSGARRTDTLGIPSSLYFRSSIEASVPRIRSRFDSGRDSGVWRLRGVLNGKRLAWSPGRGVESALVRGWSRLACGGGAGGADCGGRGHRPPRRPGRGANAGRGGWSWTWRLVGLWHFRAS